MALNPTRSHGRRSADIVRRLPAWLQVTLIVATLLLIVSYAVTDFSESDLWWQMKTGEMILKSGHVPTTDPFSFTAPGHAWVAQEWSVEVLFFLLYHYLGPLSLVVFKLVTTGAAFALLLSRSLRRGSDLVLSVVLALLAAGAVRWYMNIRPQEVSLVLLMLLLWVMESRRARPVEIDGAGAGDTASGEERQSVRHWPSPFLLRWAPVAIMLVWANCHAAFVMGMGIIAAFSLGAWWEGERGRDWLKAWGLPSLAALGATLLNPYSYHALLYPFMLTGNKLMMWLNGEWISPDFQGPYTRSYLGIILIALAAFALSSRPRRLADILLTAGALHLSLVSNRHVPLFVLAVAPILAEHASDVLRTRWLRPAPVARSLVLTAAVGLYLLIALPIRLTQLPRQKWFDYCAGMGTFPVAACDFLDRQGWTGKVYHELVWGGYLIWRYDGRVPVFVDGRNEVFFERAFRDCYRISWCERDAQAILDYWKIDTMLIMRNQMLETWLRQSPLWTAAYEDDVAIVFRRRERLAQVKGAAV
jgi:hypothetical protein